MGVVRLFACLVYLEFLLISVRGSASMTRILLAYSIQFKSDAVGAFNGSESVSQWLLEVSLLFSRERALLATNSTFISLVAYDAFIN